jgi:hypothetical protein
MLAKVTNLVCAENLDIATQQAHVSSITEVVDIKRR